MSSLESDSAVVARFVSADFAITIAELHATLEGKTWETAARKSRVTPRLPRAALNLKYAAAQIDSVVHAVGILMLLPLILAPHEVIKEVSLSAGTGGKDFDLRANYRIAEFKFINWQPKGNSVRHQSVFRDFIKLAESKRRLHRQLFLIDPSRSMKWMAGRTSLQSALRKDAKTLAVLRKQYRGSIRTVADYYKKHRERVHMEDILELEPAFGRLEPVDQHQEI